MENCYALLEIPPTAGTEEIEEAYQRKKKEFGADASKLRELDDAYNEAIMATFMPIRAFSSPLPPLTTGKKIPPVTQPLPVQSAPIQAVPVQAAPVQPQPQITPVQHIQAPESMSFTDNDLMNMDVSAIRESYMGRMQDTDEEAESFTLGIENRLARYYVKTCIAVLVFDMLMRLLIGPKWLVLTAIISPGQIPSTPVLLLLILSFVSIAYCFLCALPMPLTMRYVILGQPPDKNSVMWMQFFMCVLFAFLARRLTAYFLPFNVTGSAISFSIAAMALSFGTLRYDGD
ncbi:MAG: hypothetical protein FWG71_02360 [Synergistaceae bacterium]|nr:hypothetical protein [Synergistaceae bacterium]